MDLEIVLRAVIGLVKAGRLSIASPSQTNPFIKMFDFSVEEQLEGIEERDKAFKCVYPTAESVEDQIDTSIYDDAPFTKMMVLATPSLLAFPFRLDVLDSFERDPRYRFRFYDFGGNIGVTDEYHARIDESDRVELRFGVGYDDGDNRVVAVYLYQLARLAGKQQRIWKEYLVYRNCRMSEEFFVTSILGKFASAISVYEAIIAEQVEINRLFKNIGRPPLFRETYQDNRPRRFSFFMKPTEANYNEFVHLLDKMLSENIDFAAFGAGVARQERVEINENSFEVRQRGSLSMLEEWITSQFPALPNTETSAIMEPLKKVRTLRQKPAHAILEDKYDDQFYALQDELVWKVYSALKRFRRLLVCHPSVSDYQPPFWEGRFTIKSY